MTCLVVYHKETTRFLIANKFYGSKGAATRAINQQIRERGIDRDAYAVADASHFAKHIEQTVTRTNAMTGTKFQERINANFATSPASENYWSS